MLSRVTRLRPLFRNSICGSVSFSSKKDDKDIDLTKLEEKLKEVKVDYNDVDSKFMNFKTQNEKQKHDRSFIFGWKTSLATLGIGGILLTILLYKRQQRVNQEEKNKVMMAGKARIGGEWELVNTDGKLEGSKDLLGKWVLIYFGFTHCPDICPDEIEKMISVVDILNKTSPEIPIVPVFITVDPTRDTKERVKAYCEEFSPKLRGYTGSLEQVRKVTKTFRVYHSQGPKTAEDDYIVDHTVIMYLIDPDGEFYDYYGQNKNDREIANAIKMKVLKYDIAKRGEGKLF
uniref:Protein SCO1 homolog, mitochondrial (inferred by orthology to a human protein) n=1 Tax=Strongyloides venezuelensis TaxID=75913 RepID=A0A0K0FB11_STRVS